MHRTTLSGLFRAVPVCTLTSVLLSALMTGRAVRAAEIEADILLRGGTVYDGSGSGGTVGDVAIRGERIVSVGRFEAQKAGRVVDCAGMVIAPGVRSLFIAGHLAIDGGKPSEKLFGHAVRHREPDPSPGATKKAAAPEKGGGKGDRHLGDSEPVPFSGPADLVLTGGKLVTMDDSRPLASALAIRADRIVAVGDAAAVQPLVGPATRVIPLEGRLALPGFIEGHGHFLGLGESKRLLDLTRARDWDRIVARVGEAARKAPAGTWIVGHGWHQSHWDRPPAPNVEGYPDHEKLSRETPNHPVLLTHGTGHMCLAKGVTTFHDAGEPFAAIDHFRLLAERGELPVRLWVMIGASPAAMAERLPEYRLIGVGSDHLTVRAIKMFMDGALGTHGAWLLEPYNDVAGSGMAVTTAETIRRVARLAIEHDFQLCTHAIGDRANRQVLDIYRDVFREEKGRGTSGTRSQSPFPSGLRWRIEHAQHLDPADIPRFGQLGVIASMQGCHATSDGPFVVTRLGQQRAQEGAYAWQPLLKSGAVIVNGSDVPVEDISPIRCFYASATRKMADGRGFFPEHCMTRQQALRSYTLDAAYAGFEEGLKGSLTPGKLADVVVLSKDIMSVPEAEILQAEVLQTIVGGKVLFERGRPGGYSQAMSGN